MTSLQGTRGLVVALLALLAIPALAANPQESADRENLVKAAFIYNFAKFTRWPASAWGGAESPLVLCTAGDDAVVAALPRLAGKGVQGRPVTVTTLGGVGEAGRCHLLYIADKSSAQLHKVVEAVRNEPVLTVSQRTASDSPGSIIRLFQEEGRIRFAIDLAAARSAGLELSSRLLQLGTVTDRGGAL